MIFIRWRLAAMVAAATLALNTPATAAEQNSAAVRWVATAGNEASAYVEVTGLGPALLATVSGSQATPERWHALLWVGVSTVSEAMAGNYSVQGNAVRFVPLFPLGHDITYRAVLRAGQPGASASFQVPARAPSRPTSVATVYPQADNLPENLLKFYIQFSASMNGGSVYDHIHLRDASGKEDTMAFLKLGQELWDPTMTRLTLLMDPGRIKRGVSLNLELGPALEAGKTYTLTIDPAWQDSNGQPLAAGFTKSFRVGASDRTAIDTKLWKVTAPSRGGREPIAIAFPEPLDHALAMRLIGVVDSQGTAVPGDVATADQDRRWLLTPDNAWRPGRYAIVAYTRIEDLAGNNVGKPFDVDVFENVQRELPSETVRIGFTVE